jgi:hypothetical protein
MRRYLLPILALSTALAIPCLSQAYAQSSAPTNQEMTKQQKAELKQQEKANKAQSKADKEKRKSLDTKEQKKADKAQDKANKEKQKTEYPQ